MPQPLNFTSKCEMGYLGKQGRVAETVCSKIIMCEQFQDLIKCQSETSSNETKMPAGTVNEYRQRYVVASLVSYVTFTKFTHIKKTK